MGYRPRHAAGPKRRAIRGAALAAVAAASLAVAAPQPAHASGRVPAFYLDRDTSSYAKQFLGHPYAWGGTGPWSFDCSGLAQYVYGHFGYAIPRTADAQFRYFRRESSSRAWGGDLVFFHVNSDPNSYVYHVGIYEGSGMVSAVDYQYGVRWTSLSWGGGYYTFGTLTH